MDDEVQGLLAARRYDEVAIRPAEMNREAAAHVATCVACASFAERHQALDARLAAAIAAPNLSPSFRPALHSRIRRERRQVWLDVLPEIVHFTSCALATGVCAALAPANMAAIVGAGLTVALSTYVALTVVRESLENAS